MKQTMLVLVVLHGGTLLSTNTSHFIIRADSVEKHFKSILQDTVVDCIFKFSIFHCCVIKLKIHDSNTSLTTYLIKVCLSVVNLHVLKINCAEKTGRHYFKKDCH